MVARKPQKAVVVRGDGRADRLALPVELYTRGDDGSLVPVDLSGDVTVTWTDIQDKPSEFPPSAHTHDAGDIATGTVAFARLPTGTGASQVAVGNHSHAGLMTGAAQAVADSAAEDIAALVADFNTLLAALRTRGVIT